MLLVDDTWARGGHAQSAVLALRAAGAARVSVLVAARWINEDFGGNAAFLRGLADRDYDPALCPWTGAACPPRGLGTELGSADKEWRSAVAEKARRNPAITK